MIIDTHVHIYDLSLGDYAWPPKDSEYYYTFTVKMLTDEAGPALSGCVVIGCSDEYELNSRLLDYIKDEPAACAYIAQINLSDPACASYAKKYAEYPKYRGFRVSSQSALPYADRLDDLLTPGAIVELLGNWKYTVQWKDVIASHPETTFVIQHFGGYLFDGLPVPQEYFDFCRDMAALPNTFVKLSGFFTLCRATPKVMDPAFYSEAYLAMYNAFGPERCMYGSDWPVACAPYENCVSLTRELTGDGADHVLFETAKRVYRIESL